MSNKKKNIIKYYNLFDLNSVVYCNMCNLFWIHKIVHVDKLNYSEQCL